MNYGIPLTVDKKKIKKDYLNKFILTVSGVSLSICCISIPIFMSLFYNKISSIMNNLTIHVDLKIMNINFILFIIKI